METDEALRFDARGGGGREVGRKAALSLALSRRAARRLEASGLGAGQAVGEVLRHQGAAAGRVTRQQGLQDGAVLLQGFVQPPRLEQRVMAVELHHTAQLQDPVLAHCHTRFRFRWRWDGEEAILQSRCTDETGYAQPARASLVAARGIHSSYHYNAIQSWKVGRDGQVTNVQV